MPVMDGYEATRLIREHEKKSGAAFVQINPGGTMSVPVPRGWTAAVCVEPLGEPIAMGGGFVMNTNAEIAEAFEDYESGAMGQLTSSR
jgi:CheY-like chemotaxis protein